MDEVVELVSTLIRFDTSNTGKLATTKGNANALSGSPSSYKRSATPPNTWNRVPPGAEMCSRD